MTLLDDCSQAANRITDPTTQLRFAVLRARLDIGQGPAEIKLDLSTTPVLAGTVLTTLRDLLYAGRQLSVKSHHVEAILPTSADAQVVARLLADVGSLRGNEFQSLTSVPSQIETVE